MPFGHGSLRHLYLIETDEALKLIESNPIDLRVINAQWYNYGMGDATAEFTAARMSKTTQHVRLEDVSDRFNPLPNMLCSVEQWTEHMRKLRIRKTDDILLYDHMGFYSVARVALMFRYFGAQKVRIINGGMKKWALEGKPTHGGEYIPGEGLESKGDYSYEVINEEIFVHNISHVHKAAQKVF